MHDSQAMRGVQTRAIHAGEAPDPVTGASAPNLVLSSTFVVDQPLSFSAENMTEDMPYLYSRWANPTVKQLEEKLASLEQAESCVTFASGMAATSALLFSTLRQGDHLVVSDTNYPGTAELIRNTLPRFGVEMTVVDSADPAAIEAAMRPTTRLVWVETPANPILKLTDIKAAAAIAHRHGAALAVDSTFATPIATRPLTFGADYVVHSLTKYIGGHGDALGGAVLGSRERLAAVRAEGAIHHGGVLSPFNAWLIARGAATLPLRMRAHQENALKVAEFLQARPGVVKVLYPGLASHPQHDLARRQMDNFSGMLAVQVENGKALAARMMRELEIIHYAVSLGHHRSLIYWLDTADLVESSFRLSGAALERYRSFAGDGVFRLSVGLEDADDLCADLARVL